MNMFRARRIQLCAGLEKNSVAIIFGATSRLRNGDQDYFFRQDSDFWYLTGIDEPNAVLVLANKGTEYHQSLFIKEQSEREKQWFGNSTMESIWQSEFDSVKYIETLEAELFNQLNGARVVYHAFCKDKQNDSLILQILEKLRVYSNWSQQWQEPECIMDFRKRVHEQRVIKSHEEISMLSRAANITANTVKNTIRHITDCSSERKIAAFIEYDFRNQDAQGCAFISIVAAGKNACVMHHQHGDSELKKGELLLIDVGCEYQNYAGDISRTFPVSGRFTQAQRQIYQIVLAAQKKAIGQLRPGMTLKHLQEGVRAYFITALLELGLIVNNDNIDSQINALYPHDIGHYLGLDLHDVGLSGIQQDRPLEAGMVVTIEPGLYFTPENCMDERYCFIGIRIEDSILITETGYEVLTEICPKEIEVIEQLMAN